VTRQCRASATPADTPRTERKLWAESWTTVLLELWDQRDKKIVLQKWEARWHAENKCPGRVEQPQPPGLNRIISGNTPPTAKTLELHKNLRKAESALLVQIHTGKIGLAQFLHSLLQARTKRNRNTLICMRKDENTKLRRKRKRI
jgi:hypothetical protein